MGVSREPGTAIAGSVDNEDEQLDAVVVGGGIAGMTAAWRLRHRRILVLECSDRLGGRLFSETHGDYWVNYGAHLFPGDGSVVQGMVSEMGLTTVPVTGSTRGIAFGDRLLTSGPPESYPFRLPLTPRERVAFARAGLKIQLGVRRYRSVAAQRPNDTPDDAGARVLGFEDRRTFAEFLGPLPSRVETIFACLANRTSAEPEELSAGGGIGLFVVVWSGRDSLIGRNLLGGPARLFDSLALRLGGTIVRGARVTELTPERARLRVAFAHDGIPRAVRARHVILAVPPPQAEPLVRATAADAADALGALATGPFVTMAIRTSEHAVMPWDGIYALATPGRSFSMFFNHAQVLRGGPRQPGGSLMVYAGGASGARMIEQPDDQVRTAFLDDLHGLFPQTRGIIDDASVHRWEVGNAYAAPGRQALQPPLEGALGPGRNLHLAGDYFAKWGSMENAARAGRAAADRVDEMLAAESPPQS